MNLTPDVKYDVANNVLSYTKGGITYSVNLSNGKTQATNGTETIYYNPSNNTTGGTVQGVSSSIGYDNGITTQTLNTGALTITIKEVDSTVTSVKVAIGGSFLGLNGDIFTEIVPVGDRYNPILQFTAGVEAKLGNSELLPPEYFTTTKTMSREDIIGVLPGATDFINNVIKNRFKQFNEVGDQSSVQPYGTFSAYDTTSLANTLAQLAIPLTQVADAGGT